MKIESHRIVISSARKFINMGALMRLWNLLRKIHPADIATLMEHLISRERLILFNTLYERSKNKSAEVLSELEPEDAASILVQLPVDQISDLFQIVPSDDVAPILELLPEDMKKSVLEAMESKPSEEIIGLLHHEEETAGRIMSPNFYALNQETKISDLIIGNPYIGLVLGLAIIINLFIAALLGTIIPLFLKFIRLDPALGSVNLLTMCTDTIGLLSFLGLGTFFLKYIA